MMRNCCNIDGFCDLLHEVSSLCAKRQARALAEGGLTVAEFNLLSVMFGKTGVDKGTAAVTARDVGLEELAGKLSVSRSRVTRIMDALEKKGLVTRKRDEADHRNVNLEATKKGIEVFNRASSFRIAAGGSLMERLGPVQRKRVVACLELLQRMMTSEGEDHSGEWPEKRRKTGRRKERKNQKKHNGRKSE